MARYHNTTNSNTMDYLEKVKHITTLIQRTIRIEDWKKLLEHEDIALFKKDEAKYPPISNLFKKEDLNVISDKIEISSQSTITEKILYAALWKNGDLLKVSHIIDGLKNKKNTSATAITFHQFGRFLAQPDENPIIDQHVIRAYKAIQQNNTLDMKTLSIIMKSGQLHASHHAKVISDYIHWVKSKHVASMECTAPELYCAIDDVMFAFGKLIKSFSKIKNQPRPKDQGGN